MCNVSNFSISSQAFVINYLYGYSHPSGYEAASHCGLDLHFHDYYLEDIFMCTLAISASTLRKRLFESFAHFKIVLFIFLLLHLSCSLHIPDTNLLWGI